MDSSVIGMIAGFVLIGYAILSGGGLSSFWDFKSVLIVFGGTLSATLVAYPMEQIKNLPRVLKVLNRSNPVDHQGIIDVLVGFAEKARREGLLALEDDVAQLSDVFLQKGVQLIVDGTDAELVRSILETELTFIEDRHKANAGVFETAGNFAPAFGMLGTLVGLIQMLQDLEDPSAIGLGMAVALVTTFYGSLLSNMILLPLATKLRTKSKDEILLKEVMIEGILSIQAGENPRIVEEKLKAFLAPKPNNLRAPQQEELLAVGRND